MSLKIKNLDAKQPELMLYGVIGDEFGGTTAKMLRDELTRIDAKRSLTLHIHSEGGSFFDAVAMHAMLRQRTAGVDVVVDGLAASAASLVAMAGRTIAMSEHSWMMIHESWMPVAGRAGELRQAADRLEAVNDEIVKIYSQRWQGDEAALRDALDAETWLDDKAAVAAGLADSIIDAPAVAAAISGKIQLKHMPSELAATNTYADLLARVDQAIK